MNAASMAMAVFSTQHLTDPPPRRSSKDHLLRITWGPRPLIRNLGEGGGQESQSEFLLSAPCDPAP